MEDREDITDWRALPRRFAVLLIIISMHAVAIGHCHRVHERQIRYRAMLRSLNGTRPIQAAIKLQRAIRRLLWARRSSGKTKRRRFSVVGGRKKATDVVARVPRVADPDGIHVDFPEDDAGNSTKPAGEMGVRYLSAAPLSSSLDATTETARSVGVEAQTVGGVSDEWKEWANHNLSRGCDAHGLLEQMVQGGIDRSEAARVLNLEPPAPSSPTAPTAPSSPSLVRHASGLAAGAFSSFAGHLPSAVAGHLPAVRDAADASIKVEVLSALVDQIERARALNRAATWKRRWNEYVDERKVWFDEWGDPLGFLVCACLLVINIWYSG